MFGDREGERDGISSSEQLPLLESPAVEKLLSCPSVPVIHLQQQLLQLEQKTASAILITANTF